VASGRWLTATEKNVRLTPELEALRGRPDARITVVRSGGLGDTILLLPTLQLLRAAIPGARLTLVGSEWAERVAPLFPFDLRVERFDAPALAPLFGSEAALDATGLFSASDAVILYTADPTSAFSGNARRHCGGPVITWPVAPPGDTHAALHFARAVLDATPGLADLPIPRLRVGGDLSSWAEAWLAERLGKVGGALAIHPGSGGRRKCWPAEAFAAAARDLGGPVLLLEGPADAEPAAEVARRLPPGSLLAHAATLDLSQIAALLACCRLYLGNDSGVSHLAAALGIPTLAVFGPTDPAVWAPLGPGVATCTTAPGGAWPTPGEVCAATRNLVRERAR
jgi:heptosyltransferase-2